MESKMITKLRQIDLLKVFLWVVALVGIACPLSFLFDLGQPFGGFVGVISIQDGGLEVDGITPPWWSGVSEKLLKTGDILLEINQVPYDAMTVRSVYQDAYQAETEKVHITARRGGETLTFDVPIKVVGFEDFYEIVMPDFLNNICFWLIAFAVYRARPKDPINRRFALVAGLVAFSQALLHPSVFTQSTPFARLAALVWALIAPFVGLSLFYFAAIFPFKLENAVTKWFLRALSGSCVLVSLLFGFTRIYLWTAGVSDLTAFLDRYCFVFIMFLLPAGMLFFICTMISGAIQSARFRRQMPVLIVGLLVALVNILPNVLNSIQRLTIYLIGFDTRPTLVAVPLAFALVILKFKIFRTFDPYLLFTVMVSACAFFANLYAWFLWKFPLSNLDRPPFALILAFALALNFLWAGMAGLRGYLAKVFHWEGLNLSLVQQFGNRFSGANDISVLPGLIIQALFVDLKIKQAAIYLWDDAAEEYLCAETRNISVSALPQKIQALKYSAVIYNKAYSLKSFQSPLQFPDLEYVFVLGLYRPVGILLIGGHVDEELYDEHDLSILGLVAQQSTLFLLAAQMTHWLEKAQDEERYLIAQDLHDTTQQDLNAIAFHLYNSGKLLSVSPERSAMIMQECLVDLQAAIRQIYEIRRNLDPFELSNELIEPLRRTLERTTRMRSLHTHLTVSENLDEQTSTRIRKVIYRVVKQALDNTLAHAEALNFYVQLQKDGDRLTFSIHDDGKGASSEQAEAAISTGHMGLLTMRTRIESVGGEFTFKTQPEHGMAIEGWVPVV